MTPAVCPHCEKDVLATVTASGTTVVAEREEEIPTVALDGQVAYGRRFHDCKPEVPPAFIEVSAENAREVSAIPRGKLWPHHWHGYVQACREVGARRPERGQARRDGNLIPVHMAETFCEVLRSRGIEVRGAVL